MCFRAARRSRGSTFFRVFKVAEAIAGLSLKPAKCIVVPSGQFSSHVSELIRTWLAAVVPCWAHFRIERRAKYLGYRMGPAVLADESVKDPAVKMKGHVAIIARSWMPPAAAIRHYDSRAVTIASFVAQLTLPPKALLGLEGWAAARF